MAILPRSSWTTTKNAREPDDLNRNKVTRIVCHYPAAGDGVRYAAKSQAEVAELLRGYRKGHMQNNGWKDIGYNFAVDGSGRIWDLTGFNVGAHSHTVGNTTGVGVLFVLGNKEMPTAKQLEAFTALVVYIRSKMPKAKTIQGHQQVPGNATQCPGAPIMGLIKSGMILRVAEPIRPTPAEQSKWKTGPLVREAAFQLLDGWQAAMAAQKEFGIDSDQADVHWKLVGEQREGWQDQQLVDAAHDFDLWIKGYGTNYPKKREGLGIVRDHLKTVYNNRLAERKKK